VQILAIQTDLLEDRQFVAPVHLRPASDPWEKFMDPGFGPECDQVDLIEQSRARPYKAQVAAQHRKQLRQFIEAAAAEEAANWREVDGRIGKQVRRNLYSSIDFVLKSRLWRDSQPNIFIPLNLYSLTRRFSDGFSFLKRADNWE
jgi:hypothetical protein